MNWYTSPEKYSFTAVYSTLEFQSVKVGHNVHFVQELLFLNLYSNCFTFEWIPEVKCGVMFSK